VPLGIDIKASGKEIAARVLQTEPPVFLSTLDGIHIATSLKLDSSELATADKKMADAENRLGIKTSVQNKFSRWLFPLSDPTGNKSKNNFLPTKDSNKPAGFIPFLAANPTVEELDEWIIAMGGRELTPKEDQEWNRKVHWSPVPGEKMPLGT